MLQECLTRSSKVGGKNLQQYDKVLPICHSNVIVVLFSVNKRCIKEFFIRRNLIDEGARVCCHIMEIEIIFYSSKVSHVKARLRPD